MKRNILIVFALMLSASMFAQPQVGDEKGRHHFDPQRFQQYMEASLTREAGLTQEEAKAFFPIYNEMRQKQRVVGDEIRKMKKLNPGSSAKDYQSTILRIKEKQVKMAEMEVEYYQRMCNAIAPEKVFRVIQAEDKFHRQMVRGKRPNAPKKEGHANDRK